MSSRADIPEECQPKMELSKKRINATFETLIVTCPRVQDVREYGNYISFHLEPGTLVLNQVSMARCTNDEAKECRCKTMLAKILSLYKEDNARMKVTFDEEEFAFEGIDATFIERCKCFLGTTAKQGYEYVQMDEPGPKGLCNEKKRISSTKLSPDYYIGVCDKLLNQQCKGLSGRVLLTKKVE